MRADAEGYLYTLRRQNRESQKGQSLQLIVVLFGYCTACSLARF